MNQNAIDSVELPAAAPVHDMSFASLFLHADFVVQLVMLLLIFASFWSWAIIFDKVTRLKMLKMNSNKFESSFWAGGSLEQLYQKLKDRAHHPMAQVFVAGMNEISKSNLNNLSLLEARLGLKDRISKAMHVSKNRSVEDLERHLGFLATVGSTAPFVGLFGTVWGIMHSFSAIAVSKNTSLAVVAPGIAEALFATAIGLLAAIPAVVAYNKLSIEVERFIGRLDDFSDEFVTLVSRQLEEGKL